jgi:hypothetical protein
MIRGLKLFRWVAVAVVFYFALDIVGFFYALELHLRNWHAVNPYWDTVHGFRFQAAEICCAFWGFARFVSRFPWTAQRMAGG